MPPINVPIHINLQGDKEAQVSFRKFAEEIKASSLAAAQFKLPALKDAQQNARELSNRMENVQSEVITLRKEAATLRESLSDKAIPDHIKRWGDAFAEVGRKADGVNNTVNSLRATALQGQDVSSASISQLTRSDSGGGVGDIGTAGAGLSGISRGLNALGAGQLGQGFNLAGDVTDLVEGLPKLSEGLAGVTLSAGALSIGAVGLALAMNELKKSSESATKPLRDFVAAMPEVGAQTVDLLSIYREGTSDSIARLREEAALREEIQEAQLDQLKQVNAAANQGLKDFFGGGALGDIAKTGLDVAGIFDTDVLEERITSLQGDIDSTAGSVNYLNSAYVQQRIAVNDVIAEIEKSSAAQLELNRLIATGSVAQIEAKKLELQLSKDAEAQKARDFEKALIDQVSVFEKANFGQALDPAVDTLEELRQHLIDVGAVNVADSGTVEFLNYIRGYLADEPATEIINNLDAARQKQADYNNQIADLSKIEPVIRAREEEKKIIESTTRALGDEVKQRQQLESQIKDLSQNEDRRLALKAEEDAIKSARAEEDKLLEARYKTAKAAQDAAQKQAHLISIENERTSKVGEINAKFTEESLKHLTAFRQQEQKINDAFARDRLRAIEDLNDDLAQAARDRDVVSFIDIQDKGLKDLRRSAEDFGVEASERAAAFSQQEQEAAANRQKELANLQIHYQQRIETEIAGQRQLITLDQQFANERAALAARRQAEDAARAEALRRQDFINRLNGLQQDYAVVGQQIRLLDQQLFQNMFVLAQNAAKAVISGFGGVRPQHGGANAGSGGSFRGFSFDQGGITPAGQLFKVHEDEIMSSDISMAVLNRSSSQAFEAGAKMAGGGVPQVTVTIGAIGSVATKADLDAVEARVKAGVIKGFQDARMATR